MRLSFILCMLWSLAGVLASAPAAAAPRPDNDEEIIMDDDPETTPTGDATPTEAAPVPQRVEQLSDGQGLLTSVDRYEADSHLTRLRLDVPRFQVEGQLGVGIGAGDLASHAGPQVQITGLYRPWRHFALGASFLGSLLLHQSLVHSGFAPTLDFQVPIPLARRADALGPAGSYELAPSFRVGYISQALYTDGLKQRAEGVYLSAGLTLYYWLSDTLRVYGRFEVAFPQWTGLCEETAATRHCAIDPDVSGQVITLSGGISLAVW